MAKWCPATEAGEVTPQPHPVGAVACTVYTCEPWSHADAPEGASVVYFPLLAASLVRVPDDLMFQCNYNHSYRVLKRGSQPHELSAQINAISFQTT